jgi:hypothetical protein
VAARVTRFSGCKLHVNFFQMIDPANVPGFFVWTEYSGESLHYGKADVGEPILGPRKQRQAEVKGGRMVTSPRAGVRGPDLLCVDNFRGL